MPSKGMAKPTPGLGNWNKFYSGKPAPKKATAKKATVKKAAAKNPGMSKSGPRRKAI